ncbi:hypothetical protein GCM10017083_41270 [Thalassobaculum fulvum]|jgi:hypothetical protein|uniref:VWFA domain-containing protein n=1 Tax=Thalassobaculum fulvum TaxID=1633335 RepID=A0A919CRA9_9PROT|nr:DUF1194 domain-containing protein [Thalassobaculum fulvum]GHD58384.1 hypothetical protein GCM10017083_41270 [Thalassobaculum fulvum]
MRRTLGLLFGLSFLAVAGTAPARAEVAVDLELVLAVDVSGSIDPTEAFLQREGYIQALTSPEVIRAATAGPLGRIAVSYVEWAGSRHVRTAVDWQLIDGPEAAQRVADMMFDADLFPGQRTSISSAILYALPLFRDNGFAGTRRVIDISGDGPNNDGVAVLAAREAAAAAGVSVNGLAILNDRIGPHGYPVLEDLDVYYEECVIVGQGAFVLVADGFSDFGAAIRRKLVLEIAGLTPRRAGLRNVSGYDCLIGERQLREWLERAPFDP